ncbi:MAG: inositol monophosphatase family protein [Candidatus Dasytiphilus stammeri]
MHPILNIAIRAARKTGILMMKIYENLDALNINQNYYIISHMIKKSEQILIDMIHQYYPQHEIIFNLSEPLNVNQSNIQWIINPLNGIINFQKKLPHFAIVISIRVKGKTEIALVYDFIRNELFTAVRGQGTKLNGYRLHNNKTILKIKNLTNLLFATDLSAMTNDLKFNNYLKIITTLFRQGVNLRITGSDILDLAYVAAGRFDGYFKIGKNMMPISSLICGKLLIRESGALLIDNGDDKQESHDNIIAGTTPHILKFLIKVFKNDENSNFEISN